MTTNEHFTAEEARRVGTEIGIDWEDSPFDVNEFRDGMDVELEHGSRDSETDVTGSDPTVTGKIAWAHLKEFPDYYTRLKKMEAEAEADWGERTDPGGDHRRGRLEGSSDPSRKRAPAARPFVDGPPFALAAQTLLGRDSAPIRGC